MWLVLALSLPASAEPIEAWSMTEFGDGEPMAGNDGWHNGYEADSWWGDGGNAYASTDHNTGDSGGDAYGSGWAADNWIIRGDAVAQGLTEVLLFNEDDDTIGLVACADGEDSFYLAAHSANSTPPGMEGIDQPTAYLLKVDDGVAQLLGADRIQLRPDDWSELSLRIDDGHLIMTLNGRTVVAVDDPDPLPPGQSGFYTYDAGYDSGGGGNTNAFFDSIAVWWNDNDGDKVPDDTDNCEFDKNPGQADHDDDDIGNECDPDWPPAEDTDETDDPGRPPLDDDVTAGLDCACASGGTGPLWLLALVGLAALRRRRP